MPASPPGTERILVVTKPFIGDTVLAIPLLRNLRRAFPDGRIDVLAAGAAAEVLADCPHVDGFVAWQRPARRRRGGWAGLTALGAEAARLRANGYTRAYVLKDSPSAALLMALAGIPRRVGLAKDLNHVFLTRAVPLRQGRHQAELYLDLLRADGLAVDDGHNENWAGAAATARVDGLLARLPAGRPRVFLALEPTDGRRRWPVERWSEMVGWLVAARGCEVVFKGAAKNVPLHDALRAAAAPHVAPHVHDFSTDLSLGETGALLARMDLCVGVDTGPMHVAASFGTPVVVLFGPTDPNRWGPWSPRGEVVRSPHVVRGLTTRLRESWLGGSGRPGPRWPLGTASMDDITVANVQAAVDRLLATPPRPAGIRTLDLRTGSFRYEVVAAPAAPVSAEPTPA